MPSNFYGYFRHEMWDSEDRSKLLNFEQKIRSHGHCSGNVNDVQRRSRFNRKAITVDESWVHDYDIEIKA